MRLLIVLDVGCTDVHQKDWRLINQLVITLHPQQIRTVAFLLAYGLIQRKLGRERVKVNLIKFLFLLSYFVE
jgi:hypothetical protein